MKNKAIILFIFLLAQVVVQAQCLVNSIAFQPGEVLKYGAYYNWGIIWLNAGEAEFTVSNHNYEGRDVYHFRANGSTFKSYDKIFRVRQKYQAYVDTETLKPLWYERDVLEGNYTAFENYTFDYENNQINAYVQRRGNPGVNRTLPLTPCLFDVLSAIYYFRSVDFSKYGVGDKIPVSAILDRRTYNLHLRYLGKEEVRTRDRTRYNCLKFAIQLVGGTVFKDGQEAIVWVTDDKNKIPVVVEAPIRVGSVKVMLTNVQNLK